MQDFLHRLDRLIRPSGRIFYGWHIVLAANGIQWLAAVLWMQSYGAYMVLIQEEFGWSKTLLAIGFSLTRVESGLLGPPQGWLVDRYGPRLILRIGTVMFAVGMLLLSQVHSLLAFYLVLALISVGSSLGGFATIIVSVVNWFDRHRAKALSWSQIGFSLGGLSVPLLIMALDAFGWRTTAALSGLLVLVIGLPLAQIVHHHPASKGEQVDGTPAIPHSRPVSGPVRSQSDLTAGQALRTSAFWLLSIGHASALLTVSAVMVHLVPHLTEGLGYSLPAAGAMVALMTGTQMAGQIAGGYLGDRYDKRRISVICMFAHAGSLVLLAFASHAWMVFAFAVLHGAAWGVRGPLMAALRADFFGAASFGTIMGFSSLIVMIGMSGGPILAGYLADLTGDYRMGFCVLATAALLGSLGFHLARPPGSTGDYIGRQTHR